MKRIPQARDVDQAIRSVRAAVKEALKGLNQAAGQVMSKGDYTGAEALVAKGREIQAFQDEVEELRKKWRQIHGGSGRRKAGAKKETSPLWAYYQPVLRALAKAGGEARRTALEPEVEKLMGATLQPADHDDMARGRKRWKVMIQRTRKHLVAEGWIEDESGPTWRITESGRRATKSATAPRHKTAE